jgi:adenylate kinase family enzyme
MRVLVMGSTGSGKSTFARTLSAKLGCPHIEQDALNWDPGWRNLSQDDPDELRRRMQAAMAAEAWTSCGNYSVIRQMALRRATHLVWLDYSRAVVMSRVLGRSLRRALGGGELWAGTGNREDVRRWLSKEHPIRWAWDTYERRQREYTALFADPRWARLEKHRLRHPRDAAPLIARLVAS